MDQWTLRCHCCCQWDSYPSNHYCCDHNNNYCYCRCYYYYYYSCYYYYYYDYDYDYDYYCCCHCYCYCYATDPRKPTRAWRSVFGSFKKRSFLADRIAADEHLSLSLYVYEHIYICVYVYI